MTVISYYSDGKLHRLTARTEHSGYGNGESRSWCPQGVCGTDGDESMHAQTERFTPMMHEMSESQTLISVDRAGGLAIVPTPTVVLEGTGKTNLRKLMKEFGLVQIDEGTEGKVLLQAPEAGKKGVEIAAEAARKAYKQGYARIAHPNFLRIFQKVKRSAAGGERLWNHNNDGNPGVAGADVAALAAWTITRGEKSIRVAVLDEGVDTKHPALKEALVANRDFVDNNPTSDPDGDDAHGTACAGIIVSRSNETPGLAPGCSLVGVRIAKGDGNDGWVFDDFKTADAIDWTWKEAKADVLSNSWGGGPPADVITAAFKHRTKGRGGKGAMIAVATGNENGPVGYPATLPDVLAVGASNQWDKRKTPTSQDGENWWGSNFGAEISLLAPGVRIATSDIRGGAGYTDGSYVDDFNGTSSATPHVAAAAALILSVKPQLKESEVRNFITAGADRLTVSGKWDKFVGWGRLNLYSSLRLAQVIRWPRNSGVGNPKRSRVPIITMLEECKYHCMRPRICWQSTTPHIGRRSFRPTSKRRCRKRPSD